MRNLALLCLSLVALSSAAHAATPIPDWSPSRVATAGVDDDFDELRGYIAGLASEIGTEYHVLVVDLSDALDRPGGDFGDEGDVYIEAVASAWREHLDPDLSVLIVLAISNRDIIVRPAERWAELGWERQYVAQTIDRSSFGRFARAGDYDQAIRELIRAIELELAGRESMNARAESGAALAVARLGDTVNGHLRRIESGDETDPERIEAIEGAHRLMELARHSLEQRHFGAATQTASSTERDLASRLAAIDEAANALSQATERLPQLRSRHADLEDQIRAADFATDRIRHRAERVGSSLGRGEAALRDGDGVDAMREVRFVDEEIMSIQDAIEVERDAAERAHYFKTVTLPRMLLAGFGLLLLVVLLFLRRGVRSLRARTSERIAQWSEKLGEASTKLLALEDEHALLLGIRDLASRFTGETAQPMRALASKADDLFIAYDAAKAHLDRVVETLGRVGLFSWLRARKALSLFSEATVVVGTEVVTERKLFLPDERSVAIFAHSLLGHLDGAYNDVINQLDTLEGRIRTVWERVDGIDEGVAALFDGAEPLRQRDIEMEAYDALNESLSARATEIQELAEADPLAAEEQTEAFATEMASIRAQLHDVSDAVEEVFGRIDPALTALEQRIGSLREQGLRLSEPGFEPDEMLTHAESAIEATEQAAIAFDAVVATGARDEARDTIAELADLIDQTEAAKGALPARLDALVARSATLRGELPKHTAHLKALRERYAEGSLQPALDNIDEVGVAIDFADSCTRDARAASGASEQRYLAAVELAKRAEEALSPVRALYDELTEKEDELEAAERDAREALSTAGGLLSELARRFEDQERFASDGTLQDHADTTERQTALLSALDESLPDWLSLLDDAVALRASCELLRQSADREQSAFQQANAEWSAVEEAIAESRRLLEASPDDRAGANDRLAEAVSALEDARGCRGGHDWEDALRTLRAARHFAESAESMAKSDIDKAAQARLALADADRVLRKAGKTYSFGIRADRSAARSALDAARSALGSRNYENALAKAKSAVRLDSAATAAAQVKERKERSRRTRRPRYGSSGSTWGSTKKRSSSRSSSRSSFRSSSRSSSRSRSFSASRRSSSSSRKKSFGSSSGRSSFRSRAGKSKW